MSTTEPDNRITTYTPTVATTQFPALFPVFDNSDLSVYVNDQERTDFTVSASYVEGVANDARVIMNSGVTGKVLIVGTRDPRRENRFGFGPIPPRDLNLAFDTIQGEMQEARRDIDLSVKSAYGEEGQTLPRPDTGAFLRWNSDGDLENAKPSFSVSADTHSFDTVTDAAGAQIPNVVKWVSVAGFASAGDGGGALYARASIEPANPGKFQTADGAWWRLVERRRTPEMFGAAGTGLVPDVSALQNALNSFGILGGTLFAFGEYLIDGDLTIPANVTLKLTTPKVGFGQIGQQLFKQGGRLLVSPTATIRLRSGASVAGGVAIRADMTGPEVNSSAYAGTAFTADGHYCSVSGMLIVGFSRPFSANGFNGMVFEGNRFDCLNGPRVVSDADRPVFRNNWGHPYGTIEAVGRVEAFDTTNWAYRPGIAYEFDNCAWPFDESNWAYGYNVGARFDDCSNPTCVGHSCEGHFTNVAPYILSSAGIIIEGSTTGGKFSDVNAVHFVNPVIQQNGAADAFNLFSSLHIRDFAANGIAFVTGGGEVDNYHIKGGNANGPGTGGNGIRGVSTSAPIFVGGGQIDGVGVGIRSAGGNLVVKGKPSIINTATLFNMEAPRYIVASAASITIPPHVEDVFITGTTAITNIAPSYHGHRVRLTFESTASITKGGTFRMPSSLAGAAGQTIEFFCEGPAGGERWREIARSPNS